MNATDAARIFLKSFKDLKIDSCYPYGSDYLFIATSEENEPSRNDPFYVVNSRTGEIAHISPISNLKAFRKAISGDEIPINI